MRWPWRRRATKVEAVHIDEWVTVPFRYAEAARQTVYTITLAEGLPPELRRWIENWLGNYNDQLYDYMRAEYGPHAFVLVDQISAEVWPGSPGQPQEDSWVKWERELQGE